MEENWKFSEGHSHSNLQGCCYDLAVLRISKCQLLTQSDDYAKLLRGGRIAVAPLGLCSVFLIILYLQYAWIFFIYSCIFLHIFFAYSLYICHIFSLGCILTYSANSRSYIGQPTTGLIGKNYFLLCVFISIHYSLFIICYLLCISYYSLFIFHHLLSLSLIIYHLLFIIYYLLFIIY